MCCIPILTSLARIFILYFNCFVVYLCSDFKSKLEGLGMLNEDDDDDDDETIKIYFLTFLSSSTLIASESMSSPNNTVPTGAPDIISF